MKYMFYVLDYDGTYDNEPEDGFGVMPSVYLIPENKLNDVSTCANDAQRIFHEDLLGNDIPIGDIFENLLTKSNIEYQRIGNICLKYSERWDGNYLSNNVGYDVV